MDLLRLVPFAGPVSIYDSVRLGCVAVSTPPSAPGANPALATAPLVLTALHADVDVVGRAVAVHLRLHYRLLPGAPPAPDTPAPSAAPELRFLWPVDSETRLHSLRATVGGRRAVVADMRTRTEVCATSADLAPRVTGRDDEIALGVLGEAVSATDRNDEVVVEADYADMLSPPLGRTAVSGASGAEWSLTDTVASAATAVANATPGASGPAGELATLPVTVCLRAGGGSAVVGAVAGTTTAMTGDGGIAVGATWAQARSLRVILTAGDAAVLAAPVAARAHRPAGTALLYVGGPVPNQLGDVLAATRVDLALVLDRSASMYEPRGDDRPRPIDAVADALREVADVLGPGDRLAVTDYGDIPSHPLPLSAWTASTSTWLLAYAQEMVTAPHRGRTEAHEALLTALRELRAAPTDAQRRLRHLVLVTDGNLGSRWRSLCDAAADAFDARGVRTTVVHFSPGDTDALLELARAGHGEFKVNQGLHRFGATLVANARAAERWRLGMHEGAFQVWPWRWPRTVHGAAEWSEASMQGMTSRPLYLPTGLAAASPPELRPPDLPTRWAVAAVLTGPPPTTVAVVARLGSSMTVNLLSDASVAAVPSGPVAAAVVALVGRIVVGEVINKVRERPRPRREWDSATRKLEPEVAQLAVQLAVRCHLTAWASRGLPSIMPAAVRMHAAGVDGWGASGGPQEAGMHDLTWPPPPPNQPVVPWAERPGGQDPPVMSGYEERELIDQILPRGERLEMLEQRTLATLGSRLASSLHVVPRRTLMAPAVDSPASRRRGRVRCGPGSEDLRVQAVTFKRRHEELKAQQRRQWWWRW